MSKFLKILLTALRYLLVVIAAIIAIITIFFVFVGDLAVKGKEIIELKLDNNGKD